MRSVYVVHGISATGRYIREEIAADKAINSQDARAQVFAKHPHARALACRPLPNAERVMDALSNREVPERKAV